MAEIIFFKEVKKRNVIGNNKFIMGQAMARIIFIKEEGKHSLRNKKGNRIQHPSYFARQARMCLKHSIRKTLRRDC